MAALNTSTLSADSRLQDAFAKLPLQFEKNEGQADAAVQYLARGKGFTLFLTKKEAVLALRRMDGKKVAGGADLRIRLAGANGNPALVAELPLPGQVNYFRGNDSKAWHAGIGTWKAVKYRSVYPGIDLVFYGNGRELEFDFVAAPGADASLIRFQVEGAQAKVDADGNVVLTAGGENLRMQKPVVYQEDGSGRKAVAGRFAVARGGEIGFQLGEYDHSRALVIDPALVYASYLGGTQENQINDIAVNASGEAFVTGFTFAANFPTTSGVVQRLQPTCAPGDCTMAGGPDAFVARISADGTHLLYSTYLGGNNEDEARGVAVDGLGNAYVTGYTFSNDFPLMNPYQSLCNPRASFNLATQTFGPLIATCEVHPPGQNNVYSQYAPDAFITKLNPTGSQILYSTFFGGSGNDNANKIALDAAGNIYIAGSTSSVYRPDDGYFPNGYDVPYPVTASAFEDGKHGTQNQNYFLAFVAKFSPDGQGLLYSSTLGGSSSTTVAQAVTSMGLGQNGFMAIGGLVSSPFLPVKNPIQGSCPVVPNNPALCFQSGFLAAFDTTQSGPASLVFSTYLDGAVPAGATTNVYGVAVDSQNNVYATGNSQAHDFPSTPGALHPGCTVSDLTRFCNDAFVLKAGPTGSLTWATNYGNGVSVCPQITGWAVTTDARSNVYFAGNTLGCGVPLKNAFQSASPGADAFVSALSADGSTLLFGTLYGGSGNDIPRSIALDPNYNIYFAGSTTSTDLPGTAGSFQPNYAGGTHNGFVGKISPIFSASSAGLTVNPGTVTAGQSVTLTATVTGVNGQPAPTGSATFYNGAVALGTAPLNAGGVATFSSSSFAPGTYQITAVYGGDNLYLGSTTAAVPLTVNSSSASTTTTTANASLTFSPNPQNVTLSATVTSAAGTVNAGSVVFSLLGSAVTGAVNNGAASVSFPVPAGTAAASYPITASYTPGGNFTASSDASKMLTIAKATPTTTWANPADILVGTALSATQLNATASVPGSFVYNPPAGTVLPAGDGQTLTATFTPTDTVDYNSASASVAINVKPAAGATTTTAANAAVTFNPGTQNVPLTATVTSAAGPVSGGSVLFTLFGSTMTAALNNGAASVSFPIAAGKAAGTYPILATYVPSGNFAASSDGSKQLTIAKANPVVTWANPADIIAGTPLSAAQLNASANVAGTFVYTPPAGTVLPAGNGQTLLATFTPTDAVDYNVAMRSVSINVQPSTAAVLITPASLLFDPRNSGTTSPAQSSTIKNTGNSALAISNIAASGDYAQTNNCPASLLPGATCTVSVTFSPTATGARPGQVTITDGAGVQSIALSGTGLVGRPRINIVFVGAGTQSASITYADLKVTNNGTGLAKNVQITQLRDFTIPLGTLTVDPALTRLPIVLGNLAVGMSQTVRVYFDNSRSIPLVILVEIGTLQDANGQLEEFASAQSFRQ